MNIVLDIRPSSSHEMARKAPTGRASRRLSLPDYSSLIIPMKPKPPKKVESPSKRHPYEFEKVRRPFQDTEEDKAIKFQFKPKREYLPSQRRASLPTTQVEKVRFSGSSQLKPARRSSLIGMHMHIAPARRLEHTALSAFERQRKKHQMEEGALYTATRATEKAAQAWKRKTIVLGPLGMMVQEEEKKAEEKAVDKKQQRRESLMALLEKDANKLNASVSSLPTDDLSNESGDTGSANAPSETKETGASGENGYKLPHQISPQAVKEQKLREVFKKQTAAAKRKSQAEKKERNIEAANASKSPKQQGEVAKEEIADEGEKTEKLTNNEANKSNPEEEETQTKEKSPKESLRQEQLRMLKVALKEAAASKEPALMSLVTLEKTKQRLYRRQSMPDIMASTKAGSTKGKEEGTASEDANKKDLRSHMLRRSSAPDFSSTVAALTQRGNNPEEALKEMSEMPKHMLADIVTAPKREMAAEDQEGTDKKKKTGKKKKGNRKSSMPEGQDPPASSSSKNGKSNKKKKGSRRAPVADLSGVEKGDVYDWALAAKKQKKNASSLGEWKHIKSDANAVRRSPEEEILPLKPSSEIRNTNCLPKLEALVRLVEPKLREESMV